MIYDGFDLRPLLQVEDINRPIAADVSISSENFGAMHGSLFMSAARDQKIIEVTVRLIRPYEETLGLNGGFEEARRQLGARLYRTEPCRLWLHDAPDIYDMAIMADQSAIDKFVYSRTSTLTFVCPSPSSFGELITKDCPEGGSVSCLVEGNDVTEPVVVVDAQGPFTIKFDDADFEVTGAQAGLVYIDAANRRDSESGHRVFDESGTTIPYSIFSDFPVWRPGIHVVECEYPFSVSWRERWL